MNKKYPDEWIVEKLRSRADHDNDEALRYLYARMFEQIQRYIAKNSGSRADADDIFQEGLVVLFKLIRQNKFPEGYNVEAYLHSICRNLWLKHLRKYRREVELPEDMVEIPMEDAGISQFLTDDQRAAVDKLFSQLGPDCQKVLNYFYYDRRPMKEIFELMGYSSEQVAKNKKSSCMKRLLALVAEHRDRYKHLFTKDG